ncbi:helix-turn-helix domain-containing protein [Trueperella pyogenes]|uniref:Helix-turn-helix domain-containing protein n=1 Tax=Trueperella pecoris TaxID=2733571 RepID=A0A7M1QUK8_9ACTO|nr:helix-turn-helix domain-containing protein [Trueperella pecoris]QOR45481.1 helix-turn-helix domain-containing protein [Trueperella pecoris]
MTVRNLNERGELLTAYEVAELLPDTSVATVYRWSRQGKIPYIELPSGRKYFQRKDIEMMLTPTIASEPLDSDGQVPGQEMLL